MTAPQSPQKQVPPRMYGRYLKGYEDWDVGSKRFSSDTHEWISLQEHAAIVKPLVEALEFYAPRLVEDWDRPGKMTEVFENDEGETAKAALAAHRAREGEK